MSQINALLSFLLVCNIPMTASREDTSSTHSMNIQASVLLVSKVQAAYCSNTLLRNSLYTTVSSDVSSECITFLRLISFILSLLWDRRAGIRSTNSTRKSEIRSTKLAPQFPSTLPLRQMWKQLCHSVQCCFDLIWWVELNSLVLPWTA